MIVRADPDDLLRLARDGSGQAFTLDHRARALAGAGDVHRRRNRATRVDVTAAVAGLRWLARRIVDLDTWVAQVAAALRAADVLPLRLLSLGPHSAAASGVGPPTGPMDLPVGALTDAELETIAGWPDLPGPWRDRINRERLRRWISALSTRIDAVPPAEGGPGAALARWLDETLVDPLSPVVDLHVTGDEHRALLRAEVAGAQWLLAQPGITIWSFDPDGPSIRVAVGDPATAGVLAVLLPGTGSGLHAPRGALADATTLHEQASGHTNEEVAVVVDLYPAPLDLGEALDPGPGDRAAAGTAAFLADLPPVSRRITLVGHSYGAYTAAQVAHDVDALVLLGAAGVGADHRDDLAHADVVWAARAPGDPIALPGAFDDLVEVAARRGWSVPTGPGSPLLGGDPTDAAFGARHLPVDARSDAGLTGIRGHVAYLDPGTASLDNVARVVTGTSVPS